MVRTRSNSRSRAGSGAGVGNEDEKDEDEQVEEREDESSEESDSDSATEAQRAHDENATLRAELASMGARLAAALAAVDAVADGVPDAVSGAGAVVGSRIPPLPKPSSKAVAAASRAAAASATAARAAAAATAAARLLAGAGSLSAAEKVLVDALPQKMRDVLKWCASAHGVVYTGLPVDAVVFKSRFNAVCRSFGLAHVLQHPSSRPTVVPEVVRLEENAMMMQLIQAAFVRFPERLPVDVSPERSMDAWSPPTHRAWWVWSHLSDTRAVMSSHDGHAAAARFMTLRQGQSIHSLAKFIAEIQECRRILAVAPDSLVLTARMLELQLKNGLNARCRLYLTRIDMSIGDIEDWLYQLTVLDNEWLLENSHALPGAVGAHSGTMAAAASGAAHDAPGAAACSWCEAPHHCVDKCTKRAKWLAKGQAELHAAREVSAQG